MPTLKLPSQARYMMGGDPEAFLLDKRGYVGPLHRIENSIPTYMGKPSFHRDGCAIEFNTHPHKCRGLYMGHVMGRIDSLNSFAVKNDLRVSMKAKGRMLNEYLTDAKPDMLKGGCDPDYDAYSGMRKAPDAYKGNARYAGGHVHFGVTRGLWGTEELVEHYAGAVQLLDIFIGIPLVAIIGASQAKGEAERRRYYGQAGSFRVQPHGFEYRTPSSYLYSAPILLSGMLGLARIVVNSYFKNHIEQLHIAPSFAQNASKNLRILDAETVRHIIDTHDYRMAQDWCMSELYPAIGHMTHDVTRTYTMDFEPIATGMAALTYGAMQGHFLSTNVRENWSNGMGPAIALAQQEHWPWYKYVQEFTPIIRGQFEPAYWRHPSSCDVCHGRGFVYKGDGE